jgi:hypothetical protein
MAGRRFFDREACYLPLKGQCMKRSRRAKDSRLVNGELGGNR